MIISTYKKGVCFIMLNFKCWIEKVQYHRGAGAERLYYVYCKEVGIKFFFTFGQVLDYVESYRSACNCKVSLTFSKNGYR